MRKVSPKNAAYQQTISDKAHADKLAAAKKQFLDAVAAAKKAGLYVNCSFSSDQGESLPLSVYRKIT